MDYDERVLTILRNAYPKPVTVCDLFAWTGYSNVTLFLEDVLRRLERNRFIVLDEVEESAVITPIGMVHIQEWEQTLN